MAEMLDRYGHDYWAGLQKRRVMLVECACALDDVLAPSSVVDIGCGPGWLIEYWVVEKPEVRVIGYDSLAWALREFAHPEVVLRIYPTNIETWRVESLGGHYDLALCVDVHEDVDPKDHEILARGLQALAPVVFFAPSSPWWEEVFGRTEGYRPNRRMLERWRSRVGPSSCPKAQFFVRPNA